jgi:hypothetical protein
MVVPIQRLREKKKARGNPNQFLPPDPFDPFNHCAADHIERGIIVN